MPESITLLVERVLTYGLHLKERLERGEAPVLETEQATLKRLLLSEMEARQWVDFGGEPDADHWGTEEAPTAAERGERFLGVRYALVCWLDEVFTLDSPWAAAWNEQKLEATLYGTNDRAWKFWEQARLAEARPGNEALDAFFQCVMLGFRGDLQEEPDKLQAWVAATKIRTAQIREQEWPYPLEVDLPPRVPLLPSRERFQKLVLVGGVALLLLIPVVAFLAAQQLGP